MMTPPEVAFFIFTGTTISLIGRWIWLNLRRVRTVEEQPARSPSLNGGPTLASIMQAGNDNVSVGKTEQGRITLHVSPSQVGGALTILTFNTVAARFIAKEFISSIAEIEEEESKSKVKA